ncbi:MAG TPA: AI-2E family transporter [Pyrinomonadaceae bacterium]|jgi:predicted PurR-regulated permease PerM|nr:AI-2E family transporter [Pyrinomonadaceae bacterium]
MAERKSTHKQEVKEVAETAAVAAAEASWPQTRVVLRLILIVLGVAMVIWALYKLEGVILLLVLSIFFAYLIAPLVEFVHHPIWLRGRERKHYVPRTLAIGIVYIIIFGSLGLAVYLLLPQVGEQLTEIGRQAPTYSKNISDSTQKLERFYQRIPSPARESVKATVSETIHTVGTYIQSTAVTTATFALGYAPWLVLIPILAFFLLKDADSFRRTALQMLPRGRMRWRGDELFQDVNSTLAAYIRAQLIACLLIGIICTAGFMLIGVPYALVLGILAGFLEFIPLAGPLVIFVLAVTVSSFHSPGQAFVVFIFLAVLRVIHDYVTYPRIIGQGIHLHPLAVILAILCGAELAGVAGIFLAIPVIAIISVGYRHWMEHKGADEGIVATLLQPAEPATPPPTPPTPAPTPVASTNPKQKLQREG